MLRLTLQHRAQQSHTRVACANRIPYTCRVSAPAGFAMQSAATARTHGPPNPVSLCSVIFLRAALGPAAVAQPAIDLGSAWGALGDALGFGVLNPPFTPYEVRGRRPCQT